MKTIILLTLSLLLVSCDADTPKNEATDGSPSTAETAQTSATNETKEKPSKTAKKPDKSSDAFRRFYTAQLRIENHATSQQGKYQEEQMFVDRSIIRHLTHHDNMPPAGAHLAIPRRKIWEEYLSEMKSIDYSDIHPKIVEAHKEMYQKFANHNLIMADYFQAIDDLHQFHIGNHLPLEKRYPGRQFITNPLNYGEFAMKIGEKDKELRKTYEEFIDITNSYLETVWTYGPPNAKDIVKEVSAKFENFNENGK